MLSVSHVAIRTLTVNRAEILQGICAMEGSSASERIATPWSDDDRNHIRDGVRVDAEREYQCVCNSTSGCEQIRPCKSPTPAPTIPACH
jgi:hypothetical protein